jgi:hypothetical protein
VQFVREWIHTKSTPLGELRNFLHPSRLPVITPYPIHSASLCYVIEKSRVWVFKHIFRSGFILFRRLIRKSPKLPTAYSSTEGRDATGITSALQLEGLVFNCKADYHALDSRAFHQYLWQRGGFRLAFILNVTGVNVERAGSMFVTLQFQDLRTFGALPANRLLYTFLACYFGSRADLNVVVQWSVYRRQK